MKPETKFRRAVTKLAAGAAVAVKEVSIYMTGVDSRTREGWYVFSLSLEQAVPPPVSFLSNLEELASSFEYFGTHRFTGLPVKVSMAVRYINLADGRRFVFANNELTPLH